MKTYQVNILSENDEQTILDTLSILAEKGIITFSESTSTRAGNEFKEASGNQVQEIIEESELGPYYTEKEAKDILKI
jgi:hypothetical protein